MLISGSGGGGRLDTYRVLFFAVISFAIPCFFDIYTPSLVFLMMHEFNYYFFCHIITCVFTADLGSSNPTRVRLDATLSSTTTLGPHQTFIISLLNIAQALFLRKELMLTSLFRLFDCHTVSHARLFWTQLCFPSTTSFSHHTSSWIVDIPSSIAHRASRTESAPLSSFDIVVLSAIHAMMVHHDRSINPIQSYLLGETKLAFVYESLPSGSL